MLANISEADGYAGEIRSLPEDVPVSRMGLEQEFFLVDRRGAPCELADLFLSECWQAAREEGLDLSCFKGESVMGLVEITTPPSHGVGEMTSHYLSNLELALDVA